MRWAVALAGAWILVLAAPSVAELVAEQITEENFDRRSIGGPDAIEGVGDWFLANERIAVVVDDPSRRHAKLNYGGSIISAGSRGRGGDGQFARLLPLLNLSQRVGLNNDTIRAEVDPAGTFARLVVTGSQGLASVTTGGFDPLVPETDEIADVIPETIYEVRPGEPFVRITTHLRNRGDADAPIFSFGDLWMRGGRGPRAFIGDTLDPALSSGFHHRSFDRRAILRTSEAMAPSTFVAMSGLPPWPPVAYGLTTPERAAKGLSNFGVTGGHVTLVNAFVDDPGWDQVGLLRLMRAALGSIPAGGEFVFERRLVVTPGPDVASVTDLVFPMLGFADGSSGIVGRVEPAAVRAVVAVETADGIPVTQASTRTSGSDAGRYGAVLPPGNYVLTVRAEGRAERRVPIRVDAGGMAEVPLQRFEPLPTLVFDPPFQDGAPGRVVFQGLGETPDPVFGAELLDFRLDGEPAWSGTETREIHFVDGKPARVSIAPGRYRLTASRGLEFDIDQVDVEVPAGSAEVAIPAFDLARRVELDGVVSADFHVHAEASDDSGMSNQARLASFVVENVDVMVATDHDALGSFEAAFDALGVRDRIRVVQGVEITSSTPSNAAPYTIGHHNAWPIAYDETAHRRGAPPSQELTAPDLYALLRSDYGARVVQMNHALVGESGVFDGAYLTHLGTAGERFDPEQPITAEPNRVLLQRAADGETRGIDFDAIEVMNGSDWGLYLQLREAWYSLQRQGFRRTATGNSDTHGPRETPGYPRNFVASGDPADGAALDAAIRAGRLFTTTGPIFARFRANGGEVGDTVAAPGGQVQVEIEVVAAPWVPVDEVRLLRNGEVVRTFTDLPTGDVVRRFSGEVALELQADGFLTLEAGVPIDVDRERWLAERGGVYASAVAPGFLPQALSNPIWIDVDGDGRSKAPGLGDPDPGGQLLWTAGIVLVLAGLWLWLRRRVGLAAKG